MRFSYEIKNGITVLESNETRLYVVKRSVHKGTYMDSACNVFAQSEATVGQNMVSVLYNPERLGQLKYWRDLPRVAPSVLVGRLRDSLEMHEGSTANDSVMLLTRMALCAATGLIADDNVALTGFVSLLPTYEAAVKQQPHLHKQALGALAAHTARMQSAS
jgi:hypothetical protein